MSNVANMILLQALYYFITMLLTLLLVFALLRGFFFSYIKARLSFGKYVLVKVRNPLRDYLKIGWVEDGFLVYKDNKKDKRYLSIPNGIQIFYQCLKVYWVDVDEESNSICTINYHLAPGFDAVKHSNQLVRALEKPALSDNKEKIMMIIMIACLIGIGVCIYLCYMNNNQITNLVNQLPNLISNIKGVVIGGSKGV